MTKSHSPAPILLTPVEAAAILHRSLNELRQMRATNTGPTFHQLGCRLIRYSAASVATYALEAHR